MRGGGFPADHLLPRPARCAVALFRAHDGGQGALSGAARQWRSCRARRPARRAALGALERSLSQALLPVRACRGRPGLPRPPLPPDEPARSDRTTVEPAKTVSPLVDPGRPRPLTHTHPYSPPPPPPPPP